MTKHVRALCALVIFALAAIVAQAQTDVCTPDPVTGIAVAQMISPVNGSTLQPNPATGATNFTWCNASADYFVIIESVPGAHDIFFAFTGGAGGGAGQNFLDLGPACAAGPPTGCIPALGETIYVTLETVKQKQILGSFQYTFTAPSTAAPPTATTTTADNKNAVASAFDQTVTVTATVSATSVVNQGTVTFQVKDGAANKVGTAVTSFTLTNGSASASYVLPGGAPAGTYTIQASYSGGAAFAASNGSGTLTVTAPPPVPAATTTAVDAQTVTFASGVQNLSVTATVTSASPVNEGTVTFQVMDGATAVGTAVTSPTLNNGNASAIYTLPAGLAAATYTIEAAYSGGSNFQVSSGTATLTVNAAPPPAQTATATTVGNNTVIFSNNAQNVTLMAALSVADPTVSVNQGTVIFQVMDGATNIGTAVSAVVEADGCVYVVYALPAGLPAKSYTIQATYSGGSGFLASNGSGTLTITKAQSTTDFTSTAPSTLPYLGTYTPAVSTTGDGTLTIDASGSCSAASGVVTMTSGSGTCAVTATVSEGVNFLGSSTTPQTITAIKADAAVTVDSVSVVYDGNPHAATFSTSPVGLVVIVTYDGSLTPPSNVKVVGGATGAYAVVATISDLNYQGNGSGTLTITKALSTTTFTSTAPASLPPGGTYTPTATSTGDGTLTIGASGACSIAAGAVTITAASGQCTVTAMESEGNNFLGSSAAPQIISATPTIASLIQQVSSLHINKWTKFSLLAKLGAAQASLKRGHEGAASLDLWSFIFEVWALEHARHSGMDAATANFLIDEAEAIIRILWSQEHHRFHKWF